MRADDARQNKINYYVIDRNDVASPLHTLAQRGTWQVFLWYFRVPGLRQVHCWSAAAAVDPRNLSREMVA